MGKHSGVFPATNLLALDPPSLLPTTTPYAGRRFITRLAPASRARSPPPPPPRRVSRVPRPRAARGSRVGARCPPARSRGGARARRVSSRSPSEARSRSAARRPPRRPAPPTPAASRTDRAATPPPSPTVRPRAATVPRPPAAKRPTRRPRAPTRTRRSPTPPRVVRSFFPVWDRDLRESRRDPRCTRVRSFVVRGALRNPKPPPPPSPSRRSTSRLRARVRFPLPPRAERHLPDAPVRRRRRRRVLGSLRIGRLRKILPRILRRRLPPSRRARARS